MGREIVEISPEHQQCRDLDWFCLDADGHVGHFTTAGHKYLPKSVAASSENLETLTAFFLGLRPDGGHEVDAHLAEAVPELSQLGERYLRDFVGMAERGLFSFDIESYLKPGIAYFRVALSLRPMKAEHLPEPIREIISQFVLKGRLLKSTSRIPYEETLEI
jgi:hypothetical protein